MATATATISGDKTVGQIARDQGVPESRVRYVLLSRRIDPAFRVGRYRMFGPEQVEAIIAALREIDGR